MMGYFYRNKITIMHQKLTSSPVNTLEIMDLKLNEFLQD